MQAGGAGAEVLHRASGLTKRFGDVTAVDGIDIAVRRGEAFGFVGPNGAGKSSTMKMIARVSPGVYAFTWPATIVDALGVTQTLALRFASAAIQGGTLGFANATVTAANVVTVRVFSTAFAASDIVGTTICVQVF